MDKLTQGITVDQNILKGDLSIKPQPHPLDNADIIFILSTLQKIDDESFHSHYIHQHLRKHRSTLNIAGPATFLGSSLSRLGLGMIAAHDQRGITVFSHLPRLLKNPLGTFDTITAIACHKMRDRGYLMSHCLNIIRPDDLAAWQGESATALHTIGLEMERHHLLGGAAEMWLGTHNPLPNHPAMTFSTPCIGTSGMRGYTGTNLSSWLKFFRYGLNDPNYDDPGIHDIRSPLIRRIIPALGLIENNSRIRQRAHNLTRQAIPIISYFHQHHQCPSSEEVSHVIGTSMMLQGFPDIPLSYTRHSSTHFTLQAEMNEELQRKHQLRLRRDDRKNENSYGDQLIVSIDLTPLLETNNTSNEE